MDSPADYPLALAAEDFAPVALTTAGVLFLTRYTGPRHAPASRRRRC
nr:hypothetical protein GCM10020093_008690 [Planobispora longispora]